MLNLRLSSGINHEQFEKKFNFDFNDKFFQTIDKLLEHDLIKTNNKIKGMYGIQEHLWSLPKKQETYNQSTLNL